MQDQTLHQLNQRRGLVPATGPTRGTLTAAQRATVLQHTLSAQAECEAEHLRAARTWQGYQRAAKDFAEFLQFWADPDATWESCTPAVVLVYINNVLLVKHRGRDGGLMSPSYLETLLSHLKRVFELLGRDQPWSHQTRSGNPVHSDLISNKKQTYATEYQKRGGCETSAVPLQHSRLTDMLDQFDEQLRLARRDHDVRKQGFALRDGAMLACLWAHSRRGQDMQNVHWGGVYTAEGDVPILQHWAAGGGALQTINMIPRMTKCVRNRRVGTLVIEPYTPAKYCAITRLRDYYRHLAAQGTMLPADPLFCAMDGKGQRALTPQAIQARFKNVLRESGDDKGQTVHGMRRGRLQHDRARGATEGQLKQLSGITTDATLQRYLMPARHLRIEKDPVPTSTGGRAPRLRLH